ncbi:hypothetical protein LXT21_22150 [Myxococcus sp. K38C18041901]|uniref:hypothetical protein n=1 Tax=Myxococcus guangdongensis TaxID=2906760 RepID=UPI0020A6E315|nr:hypothetical protein [Myxococcus guangdongensis]MCP3061491.1 hypothetical protein [Myxococcus guangdongensis]
MSPARPAPAPKSNKAILFAGAAVAVMAGAMGAGVMLGGSRAGDSEEIDVGALQEMAGIQAQLRSLNACGIQYGVRGRRMKSGSHEYVRVSACEQDRFAGARIDVPTAQQVRQVTFNLERGAVSEPWKIRVDKSQVSFPDLQRTLEQLAPLLREKAPEALTRAIAERASADRHRQESDAAERARREAAKGSYPTP